MLRADRRRRITEGDVGTPASAAGAILGPVALADGAVVVLRRATDRDSAALRSFYLELSARTLFRRFMTPTPRLSDGAIAYLTDLRRLDREVILATVGNRIVGEGRFHRVAGTAEAEVALVVADAWQGHGIGPMLSDHLARLARLRGIESFTGTMLADNHAARSVLGSVAPGAAQRVRGGEIEFRSPLPPPTTGWAADRSAR
jgi:GNAT superfamily N-acetyltransferase